MARTAITFPKRKNINNLVNNGDFEYAPAFTAATNSNQCWIDGTTGTSSSPRTWGWCFKKDVPAASGQFDSSVSKTGTYSLKLSLLATGGGSRAEAFRSTSALSAEGYIPVLPSTSYTFSGWIKTNRTSGDGFGAFLRFNEFTGTSTTASVVNTSSFINTTQDWTQVTKTFTTAATTRFVAPLCAIAGTGSTQDLLMDAWFDDITLTLTTATTRTAISGPYRKTVENLVANGDFEYAPAFTAPTTGSSRWIDGTAAGSTSISQYGWGMIKTNTASAQFDTAVKQSGTTSLKLSTASTASYIEADVYSVFGTAKLYLIPALPSTSYTLSFWMKTEYISGDSSQGATVGLPEYNGTGAVVRDNTGVGAVLKTTTDWTYYSYTVTTQSTTRFLNVQPRIFGHTGTATLQMDAWFDDIVLTKTTPDARTTA